ncbi:MAG: DNA polymerase III subunit gamma/tau [Acidimicrobiales bacterium]
MVDYQSLYRRYRPQRFDEVRGQDHVVGALRHAVRDNRVAHAYLFSGPRGTGKTSTARILAKALNCTSPVDGEPCGVCDSCVDITRGASFDVHELDAASNNGVDAMRDLVSRASLATPGRWKAYIVDEVHMLSQSASNALLKTLEEPPDHVVFVLATTDPQKVLPTIRSRTQHYEFHLLDTEVLEALLSDVARDAKLDLPESAVEAAVRRGRGSARDALSALDQVVAAGVVGDDGPYLHELLVSLAERDTARALQAIAGALAAGLDAPRIAAGLLDELRGQFLTALAPGLLKDGEPPTVAGTQAPAPASVLSHGGLLLGPARSVRAMEVLGTAMVAMRDALDARITLEVVIVRLTHPEADDESGALLERIERLERRVQELSGSTTGSVPTPPSHPPSPPPSPTASRTQVPPTAVPSALEQVPAGPPSVERASPGSDQLESRPALGAFAADLATVDTVPPSPGLTPEVPAPPPNAGIPTGPLPHSDVAPPTRDELVEAWGDHILNQLRPRVRAVFAVGRFLASEDATAVLALPNVAHVERAQNDSAEVADAIGRHFGRPVGLRLVAEKDASTVHLSADPATGGSSANAGPGAGTRTLASAPQDGDVEGRATTGAVVKAATAPAHRAPVGNDPSDAGEEMLDPDDLDPLGEQVQGDAAAWAQERLKQVFPGAEEV